MKHLLFSFAIFLSLAPLHAQKSTPNNDYLLLVQDTVNETFAYVNLKGEIIIPHDTYHYCFTDTFRTYAIVQKENGGFIAIDRQQKVLYQVYTYDNGPDYFEEGMFRITKNGLIGFADSATGKIVIEPQYQCAYPFEKGAAQVSIRCSKTNVGENVKWDSQSWIYIDKTGKVLKKKPR